MTFKSTKSCGENILEVGENGKSPRFYTVSNIGFDSELSTDIFRNVQTGFIVANFASCKFNYCIYTLPYTLKFL